MGDGGGGSSRSLAAAAAGVGSPLVRGRPSLAAGSLVCGAAAPCEDVGAVYGRLDRPSADVCGGGDGSSRSSDAANDSLLSWLGGRSRRLTAEARVRPPVAPVVRAAAFARWHRVHSVLTRGLKVRVPALVPPVWRSTPRSALMGAAVRDFVAAGVLRPGRPAACYRLFPVPKSETVARLVYDLSDLTPLLPCRPCSLPSVESALRWSFSGFSFAIKIDLRDGFYHIPLARSTQCHFGVLYDNTTYVFTRLPMGLKIAPSEMQLFSTAVAELVQSRFSVRCLAYLDDFLVLSRDAESLTGIAAFFTDLGLCVNFDKSVLIPSTVVTFLGVTIDLENSCARVRDDSVSLLRAGVSRCSACWPLTWRQRLAGFVNFARPLLRLPLEVVSAVRDGDRAACAAVMPFLSAVSGWRL